jgi:hypothetical protein
VTSADEVIKCATNWANEQRNTYIDAYYLFGSSIYQDGAQFDYSKYHSDLDVVVRLRDGMSVLERRDAVVALRDQKYLLEVSLLPVLKVTQLNEPIVSTVPVSPTELDFDIHKTTVTGFFSTNRFLNLRSGETASFERKHFVVEREKFLIPAIQACQSYRNKFLAITANKIPALPPHNDEDVFPKELARAAGAVSHFVTPRDGVNEHDINEGTTYLFSLIDEFANRFNGEWNTVRRIIQQRMSRGTAAIAPEDVLLLYEILSERACALLEESARNNTILNTQPMQAQPITGLRIASTQRNGNSITVEINISQVAVPARNVGAILVATREFLQSLGYNEIAASDPEFGSFFQEIIFSTTAGLAASMFASLVHQLLHERIEGFRRGDSMMQEISPTRLKGLSISLSHNQLEATNRLLDAMSEFDHAVFRFGNVVIVKTMQNDQRRWFVHELTESDLVLLAENPDAIRSPDKVIDLLHLQERSTKATADGSGIPKP